MLISEEDYTAKTSGSTKRLEKCEIVSKYPQPGRVSFSNFTVAVASLFFDTLVVVVEHSDLSGP